MTHRAGGDRNRHAESWDTTMDEDTQSALVQGCLAVSMHMQGGMKGFAGRLALRG